MRMLIALTAAAPLALLAACGDSTPADEVEPTPMDTAALNDVSGGAMTSPPASSLEGMDFAGDYSLTDEAGRTSRITLRGDDTYDYTGPDGSTRSGRYSRTEDGNRLLIEDFDGRAGYFSIGDGALYRLASPESAFDDLTGATTYRRENFPPAPSGGPGTLDTGVDSAR